MGQIAADLIARVTTQGVATAAAELSGFGATVKTTESGLSGVGAEAARAESGIAGTGRAASGAAGGISLMGIGALAAVAAIAAIGAASIKSALQFQTDMTNIQSVTGLSNTDIKTLGQSVIQLGNATGQGPHVLATSLYDIVSSGFNAKDSVSILGVAAHAASAGLTDASTAGAVLTAAIHAYGQSAKDARPDADVMFQAVKDGVFTFKDLTQQMGGNLSLAASMHVPITELGAAYVVLTRQGVPLSEATTRVNAAMRAFLKPTADMKDAIKAAGFESGNAMVAQLGLGGAIQKVQQYSESTGTPLSKLFFNMLGLQAAVGLGANNWKDYNAELVVMQHASDGAGAMQETFNIQMQAAGFKIDQAKSSLKGLSIDIGTLMLPAIGKAADGVSVFAQALQKLLTGQESFSQFGKNFVDGLTKIDWPGLASKLKSGLETAIRGVGTGIGTVLGFVGAEIVKGIAAGIKDPAAVKNAIITLLTAAIKIEVWLAELPVTAGKAIIDGIVKGIDAAFPGFQAKWDADIQAIKDAFKDAGTWLLSAGVALITGIETGWTNESATFQTFATNFPSWVIGQIGDVSRTLWSKGIDLIAGIEGGWSAEGATLSNFFTGFGGWVVSQIGDLSGLLTQTGKDIIQGLADGISSMKDTVVGAMQSVIDAVKSIPGISFITKSPSRFMHEQGTFVMQGLANGIAAASPAAADAMSASVNAIKGMATGVNASAGGFASRTVGGYGASSVSNSNVSTSSHSAMTNNFYINGAQGNTGIVNDIMAALGQARQMQVGM